jgi:DNA-binding XRE family transcriptional regulator
MNSDVSTTDKDMGTRKAPGAFSPAKLRDLRGDKSRRELAQAINVTEQTLYNWEIGKYEPGANDISALAAALGVKLEALFE